jgi:hypothetical protein
MMPVEPWDDPHGLVQVEDHCDLAQILHNTMSERMLTVTDNPFIRNCKRTRDPLCTAVGSPMPLLGLFGVAGCS